MNSHLRFTLRSLGLVTMIACSSPPKSEGASAPSDPSASDSSVFAVTAAVTTVEFIMENLGGFNEPAGGCHASEAAISYTRGSRTLAWETCDETPEKFAAAPFLHSRVLTDSEAKTLEDSLLAIDYVLQTEVEGYDGLALTLSTFTASGLDHRFSAWCYNECVDGRKAAKARDTWEVLQSLTHE